MPDQTQMMFVRPRNCTFCGHGYYGLGHVVQHAQQIGAWDITDLTHQQANKGPIYDAIDQTDPASFYGFGHGNECYSEDTQVLTEDGWKYFYELKDEKVATLNPKTETLEYQKPTKHISYFYEGKMFYQKGGAVDLLVTPNHNLWVGWMGYGGKYKQYQFLKPSELKNGHKKGEHGQFISTNYTNGNLKYKRDAKWEGHKEDYFILPEITYKTRVPHSSDNIVHEREILIDDWMEFFGYWISEGSACLGYADKNKKYINYRVNITQNDDSNREKMKNVLERIGFNYCESGNKHSMNLEMRNKQLYLYLKQFGHSKDRFIPKEIKGLPTKQLKILFDALILGDGTKYGTRYEYSTSSEWLADDVQEIALKIGFGASINKYKNLYILSIATKNNLNPLCLKKARGYLDYDGMVYCVEVPNHIIYVRRNGKALWCGNCVFTGDAEDYVFTCDECDRLNGRVVYLLSCLTAQGLGPAIMNCGATAYAGFDINWTWLSDSDPDGDNDPYDDPYARCFWESANELWMAYLDGNSFAQSVQASIDMYDQWIDYWLYDNPEDPGAEDCIMWLVHDRNGLVAFGEGFAPPAKQALSTVVVGIAAIGLIGLAWYLLSKPKTKTKKG